MPIESILRFVHKHPGFVYERVAWGGRPGDALHVHVRPRAGSKRHLLPLRHQAARLRQAARALVHVHPSVGIAVFLVYAMRRVDCPTCGITVEKVPWANGKEHTTLVYAWFLASWAKVLSWQEVARRFRKAYGFRTYRHAEIAMYHALGNLLSQWSPTDSADEASFPGATRHRRGLFLPPVIEGQPAMTERHLRQVLKTVVWSEQRSGGRSFGPRSSKSLSSASSGTFPFSVRRSSDSP